MKNSLNISHVSYSKELKGWLIGKQYHYFIVTKDSDYYLLTPFKDIVKMNEVKSTMAKGNLYKEIKSLSITNISDVENYKLNLSSGVLATRNERAYLHLN